MRNVPLKIRTLLIPFLVITVSIIGGYSFLDWLFMIKLGLFSLKEDLVQIWIPLCLPWIPLWFFLRPRIKTLNLKRKKGDLPGLYFILAGMAIVVPTLFAQNYLQTATGKLTQLGSIDQILEQKDTKYYTLRNFYLDKEQIGVSTKLEIRGKNNEYCDFSLFVVVPVLPSAADTNATSCFGWYGIKYKKEISNRMEVEAKKALLQHFLSESQADFEKKNLYQLVYFDRIGHTDDHDEFIKAIRENPKYKGTSIVLVPVNAPFADRNGHQLGWTLGSFAMGVLVWLIMILIPRMNEEVLEAPMEGVQKRQAKEVKEMLAFFLPKQGYYATPLIIDINIFLFLAMVVSGLGFLSFSGSDLLAWGADYRPLVANGQWWRILVSTFLHGGLVHLLSNMAGLLFVGVFLEPVLGTRRFTWVYLLTGVLASLTSLWWHEATVSVGASGAIFGLYGVFLALMIRKVFPTVLSKALMGSTVIFLGYNLLMGLTGGIDNAAHLGGLVSGFCLGWLLAGPLKRQEEMEEFIREAQTTGLQGEVTS